MARSKSSILKIGAITSCVLVAVVAYTNCSKFEILPQLEIASEGLITKKSCDQSVVRDWTTRTVTVGGLSDQLFLYSAAIDSSNRIYATGQLTVAGVQHLITIKSLDSGESWVKIDDVSASMAATGYSTFGNRLTRTDDGTLFVAGAVNDRWIMRRSTDSGITWTTVDDFLPGTSLGAGAYGVVALPNVILAYGDVRSTATEHRAVIRRSTDGGSTWTTVDDYNMTAGKATTASDAGVDKAGNIYVVGGAVGASVYAWTLRKSTDGGLTWASVGGNFQLDPSGAAFANGFAAHDISGVSGALFMSGYATDASGTKHAIVRRSTNGGTSWTTVDDTVANFGGALSPDKAGNLYFVSASNGRGVIRKSMDGGSTWAEFDAFRLAPDVVSYYYNLLNEPNGGVSVFGTSGVIPNPSQGFIRRLNSSYGTKLSDSCLYELESAENVDSRVQEYMPQYALWSDGAVKRRWIYLPPNTKINSSVMDGWSFPVGTKLWKEFKVAGKKIETRLIAKVREGKGPQAWDYAVYKWREDQTDAELLTAGDINALGTTQDIPNMNTCVRCHQGGSDFPLGFEAIQLSFASGPSLLNLDKLKQQERLTHLPISELKIAGTETDRSALGYLHVNCGTCHSPRGSVPNAAGLNLRHNLEATSLNEENAYVTTVGQMGYTKTLVAPGNPAGSRILDRMSARGNGTQMPPIMTKQTDPVALQTISDWISGL